MTLPNAWASSVSEVYTKTCRAASTENFKFAHFEIVINIDFLSDIMTTTVGHPIDSGIGLSITIDKLRVFINKT